MSPRTYAAHLGILRPAFDYFLTVGMINPFRKGLRGKRRSKTDASGSVHRIPFSPDELKKLLATANGDEFMRDLIITAACSGMRRSDSIPRRPNRCHAGCDYRQDEKLIANDEVEIKALGQKLVDGTATGDDKKRLVELLSVFA